MSAALPARAHVIAGGFPPGQPAGHDHDYARLRLLGFLAEQDIPASTSNDYVDVERWLPISRLLITYVAGPYPAPEQDRAIRSWLASGGVGWSSARPAGGPSMRRRPRRAWLAGTPRNAQWFFLSHPPVRVRSQGPQFERSADHRMPETFVTIDRPYMVQMGDPRRASTHGRTGRPRRQHGSVRRTRAVRRLDWYTRDVARRVMRLAMPCPSTNSQRSSIPVSIRKRTPPVLRAGRRRPATLATASVGMGS
jgi:hypothetical protein